MNLEVFSRQKWENFFRQIHISGFHLCSQTYIYREGWLKICTLILISSHIWLNFPVYGWSLTLFLHFPMNGCHFSYKHKFLEKKHCGGRGLADTCGHELQHRNWGVSRRQTSVFFLFTFVMLLHWQFFVPQGDLATFGYRSAMKLEIY